MTSSNILSIYCGHRASRARRPRCLTVSFTILDFGICTSDMVTWCSIPRSLSTRFFFQAKRPFQSLPQHVFYQLNQILKAISPWFTRTFTNLIHRLCCRGVGAITKVIYRRICPARGPSCKPSHLWWCHNTVDGRNPANQLIYVDIGTLCHYLQVFVHPRWLAGFLPSTVPRYDLFDKPKLSMCFLKRWVVWQTGAQHVV